MTEQDLQCRNVLRMEPVACYVRVSTQEQKLHGISLDAQRAKLQEYADNHNMRIVGWYEDEGVSGRKLIRKRPELQRMMKDAQKGLFSRILFVKLDRFFRSVAEYHEFMKNISPVIWTTTDEKYDLSTAQGRMLLNMKLTISEMEADMAGERVDLVNEYKVSTGQPLTGSMQIGWKIAKDEQTGRKKIIRNPEAEEALHDVLDFYMKHQSIKKAVVYLHTKYQIGISYNSFKDLLKNTMLCGAYRDNPSYCEAYVDRETFDRIQDIMTRNVKANTAEHRAYLFSGLIKCPECGRNLVGNVQVKRSRDGETMYRYKRYRCGKSRKDVACGFKKSISENNFEKLMLANIERFMDEAKAIKSVKITDSETAKLPEYDIEEIYTRIDRLNYSWNTGKIRTVEKYEADYAELMELLEKAQAEQDTAQLKDFSKIEAILHSGWREIYNSLDDAYKRAFWRSFVKSIEINWTTKTKEITRVNFF